MKGRGTYVIVINLPIKVVLWESVLITALLKEELMNCIEESTRSNPYIIDLFHAWVTGRSGCLWVEVREKWVPVRV